MSFGWLTGKSSDERTWARDLTRLQRPTSDSSDRGSADEKRESFHDGRKLVRARLGHRVSS
jgi:hypothetical protein